MSEAGRPREGLKAAALGYLRGVDSAPKVLARGGGTIAETILARAEEHGIPVERDPDLLECLAPLEVGESIPVEAYRAVATILAFLYRQNGIE
ncbi:MAG: EscU/YscU/HrcU family type III secretion system export apparatus switch protein [Planctomycetota bacterium]|jgi:flagellar biosynthesis protein